MEMQQTLEVMFSGVLNSEEGWELRRQEFLKGFSNPKVFTNEYYIIAFLIKEYPRLKLSKNFVTNWLRANRPSIEKTPNIDLAKYSITEGVDNFDEFLSTVELTHDNLQKVKFEKDSYLESLEIYKMHYINEECITLLDESVQILAEGVQDRGKTKVGYEDMRAHLKTGLMQIDELTNKTERKGLITYGINDFDDAALDKEKVQQVSTYGIKGLDDALGGMYEGEMISLLAPSKGGKSRMATFMLHNTVVTGTNIIMWSIENGYKGWEALIRARHFEYFYNTNASDSTARKWVDDDMVRKGKLDPEMSDMELASWTDLRGNHKYGKITSIDEEFNIDTFIEVLDNAVKVTGAKVLCIDYLQLVQGSGRASKQEKVAEAYQKVLQFAKLRKLVIICPGQIKQSFLAILNKTEEDDLATTELRDAAGESYEVVKTPDINMLLYATPEELRQGRMKIIGMPSRNHGQYPPIKLNCALGSCTFVDVNTK